MAATRCPVTGVWCSARVAVRGGCRSAARSRAGIWGNVGKLELGGDDVRVRLHDGEQRLPDQGYDVRSLRDIRRSGLGNAYGLGAGLASLSGPMLAYTLSAPTSGRGPEYRFPSVSSDLRIPRFLTRTIRPPPLFQAFSESV